MSHLERELLEKIRDFGHAEGCNCSAPVYECCCFEKDQSELAAEAIEEPEESSGPCVMCNAETEWLFLGEI